MPLSQQEQNELDDLELQELESQDQEAQTLQARQADPTTKLMNTPYLQKVKQQVDDQLSPKGVEQLAAGSLAPGMGKATSILGKLAQGGALGAAQGKAFAPEGQEASSSAVGGILGGLMGGLGGAASKGGALLSKLGGATGEAPAAVPKGKFDPFTKKPIGGAVSSPASPQPAAPSTGIDDLIVSMLGSSLGIPGGGVGALAAKKLAQYPPAQRAAGSTLQAVGPSLSSPQTLTTLDQLLLGDGNGRPKTRP